MEIGQTVPQVILPAIDGTMFDNQSLKGKKYLLTFFRFATCPFCNTRIAQLAQTKSELGDNFEIVAIFESQIDHLKKHVNKHTAKFPILADYDRQYYEMFSVKKSVFGMLRGILLRLLPAIKGMFSGYLPREVSSRFLTLPLSFLIDEQGIIQSIYYGKDGGDHMPLEQIVKFANEDD